MQSWQIKALELEVLALNHLDEFIHEHALIFLTGAIYLLLALLAWVLSGALRRRRGQSTNHVQPVVFINLPGTPLPPSEPPFEAFPPSREPPDFDSNDCHLN